MKYIVLLVSVVLVLFGVSIMTSWSKPLVQSASAHSDAMQSAADTYRVPPVTRRPSQTRIPTRKPSFTRVPTRKPSNTRVPTRKPSHTRTRTRVITQTRIPTTTPSVTPTATPVPIDVSDTVEFVNVGSSDWRVSVNGVSVGIEPLLELQKGETYTFTVNAGSHPLLLSTDGSVANEYTDGVSPTGGSTTSLTFAVSLSAPSTMYYVCAFHPSMRGQLRITTP